MINIKLPDKLQQLLSGQFIRNVSWLGGAELVNRFFRLATTVTLARTFTPQDYGLVAIIYTTIDFANTFTLKGGIGGKIIQAQEEDVKTICDTSYWLNWIICIAVFSFQCIAAFIIAFYYGNNQLILPICTVACIYLILPIYAIQSALIERENRLKVTAICNVFQSLVSNIITVILALMGMGVWAIVWAIVMSIPVSIVVFYKNHDWRPPKYFKLERWREIISFGSNLLSVELIGLIKWNLDYLIVGKTLGLEALGVYFFAFNAGIGISMNVLGTFTSALYPYLCEVSGNIKQLKSRFFSSLKKTSFVIILMVILQSILVPFYVPILFGQKWEIAIPIIVLLCLSALPFGFSRSTYTLLNAVDKPHLNLYFQLIYTVLFAIGLLITTKWGIFWVAVTVLISNLVILTIGSWVIIRYIFRNESTS
jgi:O-antigen/teichoic acid export membrane protein